MERLRNKRWALPIAVLSSAAIGAGAGASVVLGVRAAEGPSSASRAIHAFERIYTDPGKCLHDTSYDPAKGAFIDLRHDPQSGEEILDIPHAPNSYTPSLLSLAVNRYVEFHPADQPTEALLVERSCPVLPQT